MKNTSMALLLGVCLAGGAIAVDMTDRMRGAPIEQTTRPPPLTNADNSDVKRVRNYAMQPPVIPHKIEAYQVDLRVNKCMTCHSRAATEQSQAPMVSITHFMDRDGQFLASISPRRYFCNQCHVPQHETEPWLKNTFVDIDTLLKKK